ncbi:MAG: coenzyme F420-0:L-glutamate ligase [Conexivisphaera sp.]
MRAVELRVRGIRVREPLTSAVDDIGSHVASQVAASGEPIRPRDVLVVSSKYVAIGQGRVVDPGRIAALEDALGIAAEAGQRPEVVELALRESLGFLGHALGIIITVRREGVTPNSSIDRSNAPGGAAVLPPSRPFRTADEIRWKLELLAGGPVGVVIADSRVLPLRRGTVGVAVAYSGIRGVLDERGSPDIFGRRLRHTYRAVADEAASAAELVMGESGEMVPMAIVEGLDRLVDGAAHSPRETYVSPSECLYFRGISGHRG